LLRNVSRLIKEIAPKLKLNLFSESIKMLQIVNRDGTSIDYTSITVDDVCRRTHRAEGLFRGVRAKFKKKIYSAHEGR